MSSKLRSPLLDDDSSSVSYSGALTDPQPFYQRYARVLWAVGVVILLFVAFLGGYVVAFSIHHKAEDNGNPGPPVNSTGTAFPSPLTILISINGFRASYLDWYHDQLPSLRYLVAHGVRAKQMTPVMSSVTYPNHVTLATGLWPESHGIVGNSMFDPEFNASFSLGTPAEAEGRWYSHDPVWITAKRRGLKAAVYFWAASDAEINGLRPDIWKQFQGEDDNDWYADAQRLRDLMHWIDHGQCNLCMMHLDNVDHTGHGYGPNGTQVLQALITYDLWLGELMEGLRLRGILNSTHIIVVSDHGMAQNVPSQGLSFSNYTNISFHASDQGAFSALWPDDPADTERLVEDLKSINHSTTWLKLDIPERYHYTHHRRIAPIIVQADESWQISTRRASGGTGGSHGFNPDLPSMKALFVAMGPRVKEGGIIDEMANVEVYNLVCETLNMPGEPNNGTLEFWTQYLT